MERESTLLPTVLDIMAHSVKVNFMAREPCIIPTGMSSMANGKRVSRTDTDHTSGKTDHGTGEIIKTANMKDRVHCITVKLKKQRPEFSGMENSPVD